MAQVESEHILTPTHNQSELANKMIEQQESLTFALSFLTQEQQEKMWEYIALTNYGTRYVPPEKQAPLLALLRQLVEQEHLDTLDLRHRLGQFSIIKARILREGGPFLELFVW